LLRKVVKRIEKLNRNLRGLDRAEKIRVEEIKELLELKKYDTTLSSINQLKQKEIERKRDNNRREQIMKEIEEKENLKSVIILSLGARKREFAMKKIFKKLGVISAHIEDAKKRGIEARSQLEAMKSAETTPCNIKNMGNYQIMLKRAQRDRILSIKKRNAYVSLNKRNNRTRKILRSTFETFKRRIKESRTKKNNII